MPSETNVKDPPREAAPRRSLLSKIIVGISLSILVFALCLLVPVAQVYRAELVRARVSKLDLVTQLVVEKSRANAQAGEADLLELVERNALDLAADFGDDSSVLVIDQDGLAISITFDPEKARYTRHAIAVADPLVRGLGGFAAVTEPLSVTDGDRLVHLTPIRSQTEFFEGALLLDVPLAKIDRTVQSQLLVGAAVIPLMLLFTGLVTIVVLHRFVLRPVLALTAANRALAEGRFDEALVAEDQIPNDELGDAIRVRNAIYQRMDTFQRAVQAKNAVLEQQRAELKRWAIELEDRVRQKTRELEHAQEHLVASEKLAATGSLAAGLAHEINNPLASIAGYAEDLQQLGQSRDLRDLEAFADFPESLRIIEEQAYRCKRIIKQLMSFARPARFFKEALAPGPLIEGVLPLVEHKAKGRDIAVLADLDPACPSLLGDRASLEQVLVNLLVNAFDVIPEHTGRITVITRAIGAKEVVIDIRDTGPGIAEAARRRIFDPFYTTKPAGMGTGLGLSICHALVTRMDGRIEVASEVGKGTTFSVCLPQAPPSLQPRRAAEPRATAGDVDRENADAGIVDSGAVT